MYSNILNFVGAGSGYWISMLPSSLFIAIDGSTWNDFKSVYCNTHRTTTLLCHRSKEEIINFLSSNTAGTFIVSNNPANTLLISCKYICNNFINSGTSQLNLQILFFHYIDKITV